MTLLPLHVAGGVIGILSGLVALYAPQTDRSRRRQRHRARGHLK
jgi:hypothetical protein